MTNWIVDEYILESRSTVGDLKKAIVDYGCNLHVTKYVPFADEQDYGPAEWVNEPTVLYGTHGYLRRCKRNYLPGALGLTNNTMCTMYYSMLPKEWMLNSEFIMLPFNVIRNDPERIFSMFGDSVFIRPNSGFKTFAGMVIQKDNFEFEMNSSQQLTSAMPETLCLLAKPQPLKGEFRFLIVDGKVVDGSEYRWDSVLDIRHDFDPDCWAMAKNMAEHEWQPDNVYVCDVALTDNGPKIIELNSFSCAGLYAMDKNLVVAAVSDYAEKEWVV